MAYTVSLSGTAEADAYTAFEHIREVAPASAARWLTCCLLPCPPTIRSSPKPLSLAVHCAICYTAGGQARFVLSSTSRKILRKARASAY